MSCGKLAFDEPIPDDGEAVAGVSEMTRMSVCDMLRKMENSDCMCGSLFSLGPKTTIF